MDPLDEIVAVGLGIPGGGALVGRAKEMLGDIGDKVKDMAEDAWDSVVSAITDISGEIAGWFKVGCTADPDKLYKRGIADALFCIGAAASLGQTKFCGSDDQVAWTRGYREVMTPIIAAIGKRPWPPPGSLGHTWQMILIARAAGGSGGTAVAAALESTLIVTGKLEEAKREYAQIRIAREAWTKLATTTWEAIKATYTSAPGSVDDQKIMEVAPEAYSVLAIF